MYIIFPKYTKSKLKVSNISAVGLEIKTHEDQQAIFINANDEEHAQKVAEYIAKENPNTEIHLAKVKWIFESPSSKPKRKQVNDLGEILPS